MRRSESNKESFNPKEQHNDNYEHRSPFNFERQQHIIYEKIEKVRNISDKCHTIINDVKMTINEMREVADNFGIEKLSVYNRLVYIQNIMKDYQDLASNVREVLQHPELLQTYNWIAADSRATSYSQQVNQFFNQTVRGLLQESYTRGVEEYNNIIQGFSGIRDPNITLQVQNIMKKFKIDQNFVEKNWDHYDLENTKIRNRAFNIIDRFSRIIGELKLLQQNSNMEQSNSEQSYQFVPKKRLRVSEEKFIRPHSEESTEVPSSSLEKTLEDAKKLLNKITLNDAITVRKVLGEIANFGSIRGIEKIQFK